MIDILLVLIIIFMVITPPSSTGLPALVPQASPPDTAAAAPPPHQIVISVALDGVRLNEEPVTRDRLHDRLVLLFAHGGNPVIFFRGDRELEFRRVAEVIDIARGAGVYRMAFMFN